MQKKTQESVKEAMHEMKKGKLKIRQWFKSETRKQAIAIGFGGKGKRCKSA